MNKRLFYLLVFLMSLSLVGIIFVQGFWIKNTVDINERQFSTTANEILINVANRIELRELEIYYFAFKKVADSLGDADNISFAEFFNIQQDDYTNETFIYSNGLLEEDYKLSSSFISSNADSLLFRELVKDQAVRYIESEGNRQPLQISDKRLRLLMEMEPFEKEYIKRAVQSFAAKVPIHRRVPEHFLTEVISDELSQRELETNFEYGIYSNALATKVRTEDFELKSNITYGIPLFEGESIKANYQLFINFSQKNKLILSSITLMAALSIIFTLIIIVAYTSALSQLIRQRQISEIKTDFINNMTHEFKTPIATMRLALDFLNNPKARSNPKMLDKYLGMVREENKRMNDQVENILQISRLEKNDLEIVMEPMLLHDLFENAISHLELIIEERNGYIKKHFGALKSNILANKLHFTNVLINLLENAVKYSPESPQIDVYTENRGNFVIAKIRDQGIGMNKKTKKNIFKKFYRAHTGNIHDVKGHGLGLAYSQRIIEEHYGEISVESMPGKGSTFTIKLPLIK